MKLTRNCKRVLKMVRKLKPNLQGSWYTQEYLLQNGLKVSSAALPGVLEMLEEEKAIVWGDPKYKTAFAPTEQGREYRQIARMELRNMLLEKVWGFAFGVLTGVSATLLAQLLLGTFQ